MAEFFTAVDALSAKKSNTIRFFDFNDFFVIVEEDADFAVENFFNVSNVLKVVEGKSGQKKRYVIFNSSNFESFVRDLLLKHKYRVQIFKSENNKPGSTVQSSSCNDWILSDSASPGNLSSLEEIVFKEEQGIQKSFLSHSIISSISISPISSTEIQIGLACADLASGKIQICSLFNDDCQSFANTATILTQISAKECIVSKSKWESGLRQLLNRLNILCTEFTIKKDSKSLKLDNFIRNDSLNLLKSISMDACYKNSLLSANSLFSYLFSSDFSSDMDSSNESNDKKLTHFDLETISIDHYVRLDYAAFEALNLFSDPTKQLKNDSLYSVLNKCKTIQGQRLLATWLKQPLSSFEKLNERLDIVECLIVNNNVRKTLHENILRFFPDIQRIIKKFSKNAANLIDVFKLYKFIKILPKIIFLLGEINMDRNDSLKSLEKVLIEPLHKLNVDFEKFVELVESTIDLNKVESENEFMISPDFQEELSQLDFSMKEIEEEVNSTIFTSVAKLLNLESNKTIKLEKSANYGFYFRITLKEEKVFRKHESSFIVIDTSKSGIKFQNEALLSKCDEYLELKKRYESQQKELVEGICDVSYGYVDPFLRLDDIVSLLDVLVSFSIASISAPIPYTRPILRSKNSGVLDLRDVRHPCIELQNNKVYIPNNTLLKKSEDKTFYIITGPNMGGKSTYIRSTGICTLLAHIGCFVPASFAEITLLDAILCRIGSSDSQSDGVSTFMSEMLEMSAIISSSSPNSLLLIDELGRGTSTHDGMALAWAIAHHIATEKQAFCLFSTHFHQVTALSSQVSCIHNLHVSFHIVSSSQESDPTSDHVTMLYKVRMGACERSFGVQLAASLKSFPSEVIETAKAKLVELEYGNQVELDVKEDANGKINAFLESVNAIAHNSDYEEKEALDLIEDLKKSLLQDKNPILQQILPLH